MSVYNNAWPILADNKIPFTIFVATDPIDQGLNGMMSTYLFVLPANMMVYDLGDFETPKQRVVEFLARETENITIEGVKDPKIGKDLVVSYKYGFFYFCVKPIGDPRKFVSKMKATIQGLMSASSRGTLNI